MGWWNRKGDVEVKQTVRVTPTADDILRLGIRHEDCLAYVRGSLQHADVDAGLTDQQEELLASRLQDRIARWWEDGRGMTAKVKRDDGGYVAIEWSIIGEVIEPHENGQQADEAQGASDG